MKNFFLIIIGGVVYIWWGKMLCFVNILEIVYFGNLNILYSCIFNIKKNFGIYFWIFSYWNYFILKIILVLKCLFCYWVYYGKLDICLNKIFNFMILGGILFFISYCLNVFYVRYYYLGFIGCFEIFFRVIDLLLMYVRKL